MTRTRHSVVSVLLVVLVGVGLCLTPMGALGDVKEGDSLSMETAVDIINEENNNGNIEYGVYDVNKKNLESALELQNYTANDSNGNYIANESDDSFRDDLSDPVFKKYLIQDETSAEVPTRGSSGGGYVPPDRGEPDLSATLPDNEVGTGTIEELQFKITNDGEIISGSGQGVTKAQSVSVEMDDDGPFEAQIDERSIGTVQDGSFGEAVFPVAVPDDIEPGEYEVTLDISYTYAETIGTDGSVDRERETESVDVTVEVPDEPRFEVVDVDTDVEPGASGDAAIEIENTGTQAANDTRATISGGGGVIVNGGDAREVLGDIEPGETATAVVNVQVNEAASGGAKPLSFENIKYRDEYGVQRDAEPVTASLAPADEQEFSIENLESDLTVGYEGDISGQVHNDGPQTVDGAVLVIEPMSETVFVEDTRYALPEIAPGESADFSYPTDVSGEADGGARQLRFTVEYMGGDNTPLEDGPFSERVVVDDSQDEFAISGENASVEQGGSNEVALEITNERSETLSNINAMLYTSGELNTDDDEAFVDELAPGESTEITFDVSATSAASAKTQPVELDFQYDTEGGETIVSDTYQHPIEVTESEDDGGGITGTLVGVLGALAVAGVGITIWWRRG